MKILSVGAELSLADGRRDKHDEAHSRSSVFLIASFWSTAVNYVPPVVSLTNTSFCPISVTNVSYNIPNRIFSSFEEY